MRKLLIFVSAMIIILALSQCDKNQTPEGKLIAKVGSQTISQKMVDEKVEIGLKQFGLKDTSSAQYKEAKETFSKEVKKSLIERAIFVESANNDDKAAVTDAKVTEQIGKIKKNFPSEEKFNEYFNQMGFDEARLKKEIKEEFLISEVTKRITSFADSLPEDSLKNFYDNNQDDFKTEEKIRASHILVKVDPNATEDAKKEKKEKIDSILSKVKAGSDFAELAKTNSECPSGKTGGDLNYFGRGQMVPPFEKAAFALKTGEISDVVETNFGYHIIKVTDHQDASIVPYDSVKTKISAKIKETFLTDWIEKQKAELSVKEFTE